MMRRCSKCGEEKPATAEFYSRDASKKDGLAGYCKPCASERNRANYVVNAEAIKEKARAYYEANVEAINEKHRAYLAANAEVLNEKARAYRAANAEVVSERQRAWRAANPEAVKEYQRAYNVANAEAIKEKARANYAANAEVLNEKARANYVADPEKHRERLRAYREANIDVINEKARANYAANTEAIGEKARAYRAANPEIYKASKQRYEARKRELPATLTTAEWQYAIDYFHGCCAVCGRQLKDLFVTHTAAADHWIPLTKGGGTEASNIVPLCHGEGGCNNRKRDTLPEAWLTRQFGKREAKKILARINAYFASIE